MPKAHYESDTIYKRQDEMIISILWETLFSHFNSVMQGTFDPIKDEKEFEANEAALIVVLDHAVLWCDQFVSNDSEAIDCACALLALCGRRNMIFSTYEYYEKARLSTQKPKEEEEDDLSDLDSHTF